MARTRSENSKHETITFRVTATQKKRLQELAKEKNTSVTELIIHEIIVKNNKKQ
jgi:uncharacterized protein (DUF1778 family)